MADDTHNEIQSFTEFLKKIDSEKTTPGERRQSSQEKWMDKDKSSSQKAYEYWRRSPFSMREVAKMFGISNAALSNYRNRIEGRFSPALKRKLTHNTRNDVKWFHGMRCYVCWKTFEADELDIDHWNGDPTDDSYGNLVPLCKQCHRHKTDHKTIGFTYKFSYGRNIAIIEEDQE